MEYLDTNVELEYLIYRWYTNYTVNDHENAYTQNHSLKNQTFLFIYLTK